MDTVIVILTLIQHITPIRKYDFGGLAYLTIYVLDDDTVFRVHTFRNGDMSFSFISENYTFSYELTDYVYEGN